ncbi:hypothetical protein [Pseudooceanicola sp.]|uniref:hypothetical protein n=1 Tax=Pseudooceanicola sp. TaxID=1914328 RepID=UPI00405813E3
MTNSKRGEVSFEADGETLTLRLGTNAMARYQDAAGETVQDAFKALEGATFDIVRVRRLFWVALPKGMTEEDAGDLIDIIGIDVAAEKLGEAVIAAFPDAAEVEPGNPPKPRKSKKAT